MPDIWKQEIRTKKVVCPIQNCYRVLDAAVRSERSTNCSKSVANHVEMFSCALVFLFIGTDIRSMTECTGLWEMR